MPHAQLISPEGTHGPSPPALELADVLAEIRMSPSAFYRLRARGEAPRMIKLPNGELRCRRADLDAWWAACERETPEWR
ncbi:DNA-binding protein [Streptomyces sp. NPDC048057]|uniref:helix-turn-helix transcriptional regulator n=1 Tax=Streptomyces sp. NPDC048057 TaxID=3155628 RepID=UPI0034014385